MRRLLLAVLVSTVLTACGGGSDAPPSTSAAGPSVLTTKPPWPRGDRQVERIRAAGLPTLDSEGQLVHFHAHLDVFADGEPVAIPANIGVDLDARKISPLHTHTGVGILHVEAAEDEAVTLGQFLTEWGVRATASCIGPYCAPAASIVVYIDGERQTGPATDVVITADKQIVLVLGPPPAEIPFLYDCSRAGPESGACRNFKQP